MTAKLSKWLLSESALNISNVLALGASIGAFGVYFIPQSICLRQLKEWVHMYSHGMPTPLDVKVENRAKEVLKLCDIREHDKKNVDFFTVYGLDVFTAGCTNTRFGTIIGLPSTFSYQSVNEVPRSTIKLRNVEDIEWASEAGKKFQESLVVSYNAQKFVIAREIYFSNNPTVYIYGCIAAIAVNLTCGISKWGNKRGKLFQKPRSLRFMLYALSSSFGYLTYVALKDAMTLYWEKLSDEQAASLGEDFLKGGLDFYQNLLDRNKALRILMGKYGEENFTMGGNEAGYLVRTPTLPVTTRIEYLKEQLEKIKNSK